MGTCCGDDEEYSMATRFYCRPCIFECFGRPKRIGKWDNQPCLACGETLLDEGMWHNIPGCEETCDVSCQYTILISDWIKKKTPIEAVWRRTVQRLDKLDWDAEPIINLLDPEQFHKHYQELAPTREEQEQWLEQLNA
ncbi:hypothetical protein G9A89_013533 [Geosiphon pyriformis]|nr:hypothetical protein G9A89_013533 [Geosiphon pyriformis]